LGATPIESPPAERRLEVPDARCFQVEHEVDVAGESRVAVEHRGHAPGHHVGEPESLEWPYEELDEIRGLHRRPAL
jgi:hypothetical protein